jgi:hypothetical protein
MTQYQTLTDLLHLLAKRNPAPPGRSPAIYYDGVGEPLYEICLYYPVRPAAFASGSCSNAQRRTAPNGCQRSHIGDPTTSKTPHST